MKYQPPVLLKTQPELRVEENLYYEVASNGVFQVKDSALYRAVTQVTRDVPGLYPSRERLEMRFPPLPAQPLEEVLAFFAEVNERFEGEAIVMIFYDPEARSYCFDAPPQRIPGYRDYRGNLRAYLRLDYGRAARPEGHLLFGTIHSHADLSAYSSGVDCNDERFGDGLHIVYGHFGSSALSRCAGFAAGGRRFHVEPAQVLPECGIPEQPARADWMARVTFEETSWSEAARGGNAKGRAVPLIGEDPYGEA
jgi:hypothetical protein